MVAFSRCSFRSADRNQLSPATIRSLPPQPISARPAAPPMIASTTSGRELPSEPIIAINDPRAASAVRNGFGVGPDQPVPQIDPFSCWVVGIDRMPPIAC